ncbi:MAG: rod-binding protein, partial [Tranquillimonas sp.]
GPAGAPAMKLPALRKAAESLETQFLAQMLAASGLGQTPSSFGGGTGEGQFASYLHQAQAERIVAAGGIGLAERIFHALAERSDVAQ